MTVTSATAASPAAATSSSSTTSALSSLSGNLNSFLNLLMTQLKNQDPTAPMDTNAFTTQLVQFSSVEQQISTNSNLNTLIQATQSNTLLNSSSMVGNKVQADSNQLSLQNGQSTINFNATSAQPLNVSVQNQAGITIASSVVNSTVGTNSWSWNGKTTSGTQMPDGAYKVVVTDASGGTVPFTVLGTATSVQRSGTTVDVQIGSLKVDLSKVESITAK